MYAGLEKAKGDYVVIMDVDLQDPPHLLPEMFSCLEQGYDSVATRRVNRKGEPVIRSFFARMFYKLMKRISKTEIVDGARDYRLMTRQMVDAILSMGEYNRFTKGIYGWVGFRTKWLEFENVERAKGETKWNFWKLLVYSIEGITAFSTAPASSICPSFRPSAESASARIRSALPWRCSSCAAFSRFCMIHHPSYPMRPGGET